VSKIFVQDNFFPKDIYNIIIQEMLSVEYVPPPVETRQAFEGSCYWNLHRLEVNCELNEKTKDLIKHHFYFKKKLNHITSCYTMVGAADKPKPHSDMGMGAQYQLLIYMHGEESTNNGTGFYEEKENNEYQLNTHIGFKCNRAIFFSSEIFHSPLQWMGGGSFRYSICNFFTVEDKNLLEKQKKQVY
jgi:hypothetical protein